MFNTKNLITAKNKEQKINFSLGVYGGIVEAIAFSGNRDVSGPVFKQTWGKDLVEYVVRCMEKLKTDGPDKRYSITTPDAKNKDAKHTFVIGKDDKKALYIGLQSPSLPSGVRCKLYGQYGAEYGPDELSYDEKNSLILDGQIRVLTNQLPISVALSKDNATMEQIAERRRNYFSNKNNGSGASGSVDSVGF